MTWNYRIIRKHDPPHGDMYGIHEVFYNARGKPDSCTVDPVDVTGESSAELKSTYKMMAEAFHNPVLDYDDFGKPKAKRKKLSKK